MKKIILCDINQPLVDEWRAQFNGIMGVEVHHSSIFDHSADAIVSPANSFGFMDGGIDYLLSMKLGWHVQTELQFQINKLPERELLVGRSITVATGHSGWPYLISAPTMRVPMILGASSVNVYLAMIAIMAELKHNERINSVAIPGLGTGVGRVPPKVCAHQMRSAYDMIFTSLADISPITSWHDAQARHQQLCLSSPRDLQK